MQGYNFTERTRKVLALSREEAHRLGHEYVGTEHILLGLIREGEGVATAALQSLGVDLSALRSRIETTVKGSSAGKGRTPDLPYTSRAKKVLEFSMSEARELNHSYVGTEHVLLGLIREEKGIAAQVLIDTGLTLETTRAEILRLLGGDDPSPPQPAQRPGRREWATDGRSAEAQALGPRLAELYHTLRNELGWMFVKWDQFQELYGGSRARLDLLNGTAPLFFRVIQEALWNDMASHLRALTAKPGEARGPKMSVHDLPEVVDDEKLRADLHGLIARAARATEWAHVGPSRRPVRGDLGIALERKAQPLDGASRTMVTDALESIAAVINHVSWHCQQSTTTFETVGYPHGAVGLVYSIQQGRSAREIRRALGDRDDPPPQSADQHSQ